MTYKDKDRQREAQRNWVRQKRAEQSSTKQGSTKLASIPKECIMQPEPRENK